MDVPRPSDAAKDAFRALVPDAPHLTVRPMFANLGAFVNGNMFMALYGDQVAFKMSGPDLAAALDRHDAHRFEPNGRTMREYVALPLTAPGLEDLVDQAIGYVSTLPPKKR